MKTLIITSSRKPDSLSRKICEEIKLRLQEKKGTEISYIDLSTMKLNFAFEEKTPDQEKIHALAESADNYIFGTPIYNYSFGDTLKVMLDTCFPGHEHKLFGVCAAAGGEKSYLATMNLIQTCMKEWRMIPLPRVVYATKEDFDNQGQPNEHLENRIQQFVDDFYQIGTKLQD